MKKILLCVIFFVLVLSSCSAKNQPTNTQSTQSWVTNSGIVDKINTWMVKEGNTWIVEKTNSWTISQNSNKKDEKTNYSDRVENFHNQWHRVITDSSAITSQKWDVKEIPLTKKWEESCFQEVCIPTKYTKQYWSYDENWQEEEQTIKYLFEKNHISRELSEPIHLDKKEVFLLDWYIMKIISDSWCWSEETVQKLFDKNLKEVNYVPSDIKSFSIWNIEYVPQISIDNKSSIMDKFISNISPEDEKQKYFGTVEELRENIIKEVSKEVEPWDMNNLAQVYSTSFEKYSKVTFYFVAKNYPQQADRFLFLNKNLALDKDWNLTDLKLTEEIFKKYYKSNTWEFLSIKWQEYDKWRVESVKQENLPLFKLVKIDWFEQNWKQWYLLYVTEKYQVDTTAELCKPLVYYYSKNPEKNSLTLNLKQKDFFTKIIPEFSSNNSWDFLADNGKIQVKDKKFDYLYYSLVNFWYEHNANWWIVKGEDIIDFFEDKLTKINFLDSEKRDFIEFWKELYKAEKYYFVSFKYTEELDKIIKLDFSKKPDKVFRVLLDSYELSWLPKGKEYFLYDKKNKTKFDKNLIKRFERWNSQAEVFEWWWVLKTSEKRYVK